MKTIYLMRHGRTLFNVMGLNQNEVNPNIWTKKY